MKWVSYDEVWAPVAVETRPLHVYEDGKTLAEKHPTHYLLLPDELVARLETKLSELNAIFDEMEEKNESPYKEESDD